MKDNWLKTVLPLAAVAILTSQLIVPFFETHSFARLLQCETVLNRGSHLSSDILQQRDQSLQIRCIFHYGTVTRDGHDIVAEQTDEIAARCGWP